MRGLVGLVLVVGAGGLTVAAWAAIRRRRRRPLSEGLVEDLLRRMERPGAQTPDPGSAIRRDEKDQNRS